MFHKMERTYLSTGERIRNYLGLGLLLSLMLNAFVTPLYPNLTTHNTYVRPGVVSITHLITVKTPPPTPPPTPQPHRAQPLTQAPAPPILVHPPAIQPTSGIAEPPYVPSPGAIPGGIPGADGVAPTAGATAGVATVGPLCSNPNVDASVITPMTPDYPDVARDLGLGPVTALVAVTIDAHGSPRDLKILKSSGNAAIDQAALRAARQTSYAPKIANCAPVEGTYLFHADFEPN